MAGNVLFTLRSSPFVKRITKKAVPKICIVDIAKIGVTENPNSS